VIQTELGHPICVAVSAGRRRRVCAPPGAAGPLWYRIRSEATCHLEQLDAPDGSPLGEAPVELLPLESVIPLGRREFLLSGTRPGQTIEITAYASEPPRPSADASPVAQERPAQPPTPSTEAPMSSDPATESEIDSFHNEHGEAMHLLANHPYLTSKERMDRALKLGGIAVKLVVVTATTEAIRAATREIRELIGGILQRDPAKMRRQAERLRERGKADKAAEIEQQAEALEARRGNGG
jgi:hypothetical protein